MTIPFHENALYKNIRIDLANPNNKAVKENGFNDTTILVSSQFITPNGELFYSVGNHYNANFKREYEESIEAIKETNERDYVLNTNRFSKSESGIMPNLSYESQMFVYNNEIIFSDDNLYLYNILKHIPDIKDELKNYFDRDILIPKMSYEEIFKSKRLSDIFENDYENLERTYIKVKAVEHLKLLREKLMQGYYRMSTSSEVLLKDVRIYLNKNVFPFSYYCCHTHLKDAYSSDTWKIIRSLILSKIAVCSYFIKLCEKSRNPLEALNKLYNQKVIGDDHFLDIAVMALGFDKIESFTVKQNTPSNVFENIKLKKTNTITTSKRNIYKTFFNYLIMDFHVCQLPHLIFDEDKNEFIKKEPEEFILTGEEREYKNDIELIKMKIPYKDRPKYFI